MKLQNAAYFFICAISIVLALIYGQQLLIPFVLALLLWFIMRELKTFLDKVPFIKNFPSWFKTILSSITIVFVFVVIFDIILININELSHSYSKYQVNVDMIVQKINETFNMNIMETISSHSGDINFGQVLSAIFSSFTDLIGNAFMIIIYSLFILLEESNFGPKLRAIFSDNHQYERLTIIFKKIERSISSYFRLKAFVSLVTGGLSYLVLRFIGVDSPEFWAFLIFILNFIPTIGSLIGTVFPAVFCLLQFGEFWPCILVLLTVGAVQLIVGNILEPRLMGSSMNISPLVTILSLSLWGALWGVIGMILSVPITVVLIIIFSQFESTRTYAILLSEKGQLSN